MMSPKWERDKATTRGGEGHDVPQWDDEGGMMSPNGNGTKQPHVGGRGMMSPNGNGTKQPHVGERGMMSPNGMMGGA